MRTPPWKAWPSMLSRFWRRRKTSIPPEPPEPAPIAIGVEAIRANAALAIEQLGPASELGDAFGYNRDSVKWVEGFIERQRIAGGFSAATVHTLVQVLGSFLGESVIHAYGGEWRTRDGVSGVFFDDRNAVFPFAKVGKQFDQGLANGESILGFFEAIPIVFKLANAADRPSDPPAS